MDVKVNKFIKEFLSCYFWKGLPTACKFRKKNGKNWFKLEIKIF